MDVQECRCSARSVCKNERVYDFFLTFRRTAAGMTGATGHDRVGRAGLGFGRPPWDSIQDLIHLRPSGPYVF